MFLGRRMHFRATRLQSREVSQPNPYIARQSAQRQRQWTWLVCLRTEGWRRAIVGDIKNMATFLYLVFFEKKITFRTMNDLFLCLIRLLGAIGNTAPRTRWHARVDASPNWHLTRYHISLMDRCDRVALRLFPII